MKRFYWQAGIVPSAGGYALQLDGKPVRTPARRGVVAPTEVLALAAAAEWEAQGKEVRPDDMPLTQLLMTALDRVAEERPAMQNSVLAHLDTDLLCYRAAADAPVAARQRAAWDPWLGWFARRYESALATTEDLQALRQPAAAQDAAAAAVSQLDDFAFAALQLVVGLTGSLVIGLAFIEAAITPAESEAAIYIEEDWKAEFYREDIHGTAPHEERRRLAVRRDLQAARQFLALLKN